jgi:hypothetical protein
LFPPYQSLFTRTALPRHAGPNGVGKTALESASFGSGKRSNGIIVAFRVSCAFFIVLDGFTINLLAASSMEKEKDE